VTSVLETCKGTWRRAGVRRDVAAEMAADLEADLAAAAADDVSAEEYVGHDPRAFALAWATERGVVEPRPRLVSTALAGLAGAVPGAGFALFVAYGLSSSAMSEILGGGRTALSLPPLLLLGLYGLGAVFAYAGALAAVYAVLRWRLDPAAARTVRSLASRLPVGTAVAIGLAVAFASTRRFSTDARTVLGDVLVVTAVFGLTVAAVRFRSISR
jgi:uncharacterized membrane protein YidH (DUF202 family)